MGGPVSSTSRASRNRVLSTDLVLLEIQDQEAKLHVHRIKRGRFTRMQQRCGNIPLPPRNRDEGDKHVGVRQILVMGALQ